jgi:fatty acid-binding protein DegV
MKNFTILIKFNDGTNKCIKIFSSEKEAINQFESIVKSKVEEFDKSYESYVFLCGSNKSMIYDEYFSFDRDFFPIGFEIIELEIDD